LSRNEEQFDEDPVYIRKRSRPDSRAVAERPGMAHDVMAKTGNAAARNYAWPLFANLWLRLVTRPETTWA